MRVDVLHTEGGPHTKRSHRIPSRALCSGCGGKLSAAAMVAWWYRMCCGYISHPRERSISPTAHADFTAAGWSKKRRLAVSNLSCTASSTVCPEICHTPPLFRQASRTAATAAAGGGWPAAYHRRLSRWAVRKRGGRIPSGHPGSRAGGWCDRPRQDRRTQEDTRLSACAVPSHTGKGNCHPDGDSKATSFVYTTYGTRAQGRMLVGRLHHGTPDQS